jgi:hypothetical protein
MDAKGGDELSGQSHGTFILYQQTQTLAELDDQSRLDRQRKFHFHEADILANRARVRGGSFSGHPRNLPDRTRRRIGGEYYGAYGEANDTRF